MKPMLRRFVTGLLLVAVALAPGASLVQAASPLMPAMGSAVLPLQFHLTGTIAAATYTGIIGFRVPFDARVLYVTAFNRAKGGTQGVATLTCNNGASAFTNAIDLTGTAATMLEATLVTAQASLAKDATVTCDLVISGGTAPTISDITVSMWLGRRS